ncbi:hypothetical protein BDN70DRAFT_876369 [Pholiota conissans]|uniref:RlpA-like protein double-psi beta-barrel domain-containing protein n=1 Tax=Pholiota conissans TaxID=109636 RepID=A0A9P6CW31_9AGAR|nr:hypothetical protein BDN70DRAFT_876369 [Pholiota conissans]
MHSFAPSLSYLLSLFLLSLQAVQSISAAELAPDNVHNVSARGMSYLRHRRGHGDLGPARLARSEHVRRGAATFTHFKTGLGACGGFNQPSDFIVAMDKEQFDAADHCGQAITIKANGKVAHATIVDRCEGCGYGNLDLTDGLYAFFDPSMFGTFSGEWEFGNGAPAEPTTTKKPTPTPTPKPTSTKTSTHPTTTSTTSKTKTTTSTTSTKTTSTSTASTTSTSTSTTAAATVATEVAGNIEQIYLALLGMSGVVLGSLDSTA